jgi:hypothetical protein
MVDVVRESGVLTGMDSALERVSTIWRILGTTLYSKEYNGIRLALSLIASYYCLTVVYAKSDMSWRRRAARDFKAALDREET